MSKSRQPTPLAPPPQLYRASSALSVQVSKQTLSPPTSIAHHQISPPPFSPVSRTHQNRKVPRSLDTSPSKSELSDFLLPPQTGVTSPTKSFSQPLFNPNLTSPLASRKPYPGVSGLIPGSQRAFIQRKTLNEIQIFTNLQNNQLKFLCSDIIISPYDSETWEVMLSNEKFPTTNSG